MDTKTFVVGQTVALFGCGYWKGTVVSITSDGVGIDSPSGFAQFDNEGKETEDSRYCRLGVFQNGPGPEWLSWELKPLDEVNLARNVSVWLIEFLKSGEKPADEIFKEAEKKFGNAGAQIREASDRLLLSKRQKNGQWYWSLRWGLNENNVVLRLAPNHL